MLVARALRCFSQQAAFIGLRCCELRSQLCGRTTMAESSKEATIANPYASGGSGTCSSIHRLIAASSRPQCRPIYRVRLLWQHISNDCSQTDELHLESQSGKRVLDCSQKVRHSMTSHFEHRQRSSALGAYGDFTVVLATTFNTSKAEAVDVSLIPMAVVCSLHQ